MKRILILLLSATVFTACSKDDDPTVEDFYGDYQMECIHYGFPTSKDEEIKEILTVRLGATDLNETYVKVGNLISYSFSFNWYNISSGRLHMSDGTAIADFGPGGYNNFRFSFVDGRRCDCGDVQQSEN